MKKARKIMKVKYDLMQTERYKTKRRQRMNRMRELRQKRAIKNIREYLVVANGIFGEDRINSRIKLITMGNKERDDDE